jgi:hypothetical protein
MLLDPHQLEGYAFRYNRLNPDVEAVHDQLQRRTDRVRLMQSTLLIIKKHGAEKYAGVTLLHRHFGCPNDSVFIERKYTPVKGHASVLVTKAEKHSNAPRRTAPHRFAFGSYGVLLPLEYTTDTVAIRASQTLSSNSALIAEMSSFMRAEDLGDILGIGVFPRNGIGQKLTSVFLEESDFPSRKSVVHVLPRLPHEIGRTIPPLWIFGDGSPGCCSQQCQSYCHHPDTPGLGYCGHRRLGHIPCA